MGVNQCSRKACTEISCDTYIDELGYLCYDCQSEFKEQMDKEANVLTTEGQIREHLKRFMAIPKIRPSFNHKEEITVDEFFKRNTKD